MPNTALALAYPQDRTARTIPNQYLCGHEIMVPRYKAEKNIRSVIRENESTETSGS